MEAQMIIRKGDVVAVIAGKDKGKKGRILNVNREANRVLVEKVNMIKRHQKPNNKHPQGGIIEKEAYLHASNVLVFCDKCARGVRLKTVVNGARKSRACVKCDSVIVVKK